MDSNNINDYYQARAAEYEQIYYRDNPARQKELADEAERLQTLVRGKQVLELACGTGYWTRVMAGTAARITAVDLSENMIATAKAKSEGVPVDFVVGDMFDDRFAANPVDLVALGFWYSHQPKEDIAHLFESLKRPLTKGGLIWMVDNNPPAEGPDRESARVDEHGNNYKRRYLNDGREFVILKNYFSKADLQACWPPGFAVKSLVHNEYYWSVVLQVPA